MRTLNHRLTVLLAAMMVGVLLAPQAVSAEPKETDKPEKAGEKAVGCPMCRMHMQRMQMLGKMNAMLAEAAGAAEAEDADVTGKKVAAARKVLAHQKKALHAQMQRHMRMMHGQGPEAMKKMREKMAKHMKQMKAEKGDRKPGGKRCPMCGKSMGDEDEGRARRAEYETREKHEKKAEHEAHRKHEKKGEEVVNRRCPIKGRRLKSKKVPSERTCMFHGRRVGFCCEGCRAKWDKYDEKTCWKKFRAAMHRKHGEREGEKREEGREREQRGKHEGGACEEHEE